MSKNTWLVVLIASHFNMIIILVPTHFDLFQGDVLILKFSSY